MIWKKPHFSAASHIASSTFGSSSKLDKSMMGMEHCSRGSTWIMHVLSSKGWMYGSGRLFSPISERPFTPFPLSITKSMRSFEWVMVFGVASSVGAILIS
ncbi:2-oxoglutarate (2OG) and Fe(II)-dependent oxygenase superfamily protein [Trifolium repens]|nr:2-oxoglutarate (2OG) and Fe(II)-dependent oxygenase superfamily protein [Trifolium repens]